MDKENDKLAYLDKVNFHLRNVLTNNFYLSSRELLRHMLKYIPYDKDNRNYTEAGANFYEIWKLLGEDIRLVIVNQIIAMNSITYLVLFGIVKYDILTMKYMLEKDLHEALSAYFEDEDNLG